MYILQKKNPSFRKYHYQIQLCTTGEANQTQDHRSSRCKRYLAHKIHNENLQVSEKSQLYPLPYLKWCVYMFLIHNFISAFLSQYAATEVYVFCDISNSNAIT
jgi:hypothetical protein